MYSSPVDHYGLKYARDNWREILDQLEKTQQPVTLNARNIPIVVLLPSSTWNEAVDLVRRLTGTDLTDAPQPIDATTIRNQFLALRTNAKHGTFTALTRWRTTVAVAVPPDWYNEMKTGLTAISGLKDPKTEK